MNKNIIRSIKFLIKEFKRSKIKEANQNISKQEKITLSKLSSFFGKNK